jgi:hypothetical protein
MAESTNLVQGRPAELPEELGVRLRFPHAATEARTETFES